MKPLDTYTFVCHSLALSEGAGLRQRLRGSLNRDEVVWTEVIELASQQLVCPALYTAYGEKDLLGDLPEDVCEYLEAAHALNASRNERLQVWTAEIVSAINAVGVEPLILKGMAGLLLRTYPDEGVRVVRDLDVLVPRSDADRCEAALRSLGYVDLNPPEKIESGHHHRPWLWREEQPMIVELHEDVVDARWREVLPTEAVIRRSVALDADGAKARVPSPRHRIVHAVAHAIDHATIRHGRGWHARLPIRQMLESIWLRASLGDQVDWSQVLDDFARSGKATAARTVLFLTERTLNARVPSDASPDLGTRVAYWSCLASSRCPQLSLACAAVQDAAWQLRCALRDPKLATRFASKLHSPLAYLNTARRVHATWDDSRVDREP